MNNNNNNTTTNTDKINSTISESASDILGQFYCAFGLGAGAIRIQRSTIAALRARYAGPIADAVNEWESAAPHVLSFLTQVGRLSALLATQAGRTAVSPADFTQARERVEAGVHRSAEHSGKLIAGPYCPTLPSSSPGPIKSETPEILEVPAPQPATVVATTH
jgi:hypothetical protein